ncbi:tetratricopeptide repeat protein [Micromonospora sp. ATCC 39149]|uniref:tetratricopeptide repeat protein n=1 Tax=Micromonospora sp. (strain ATCC 39149 / NRRL 15099 / SCC 1413) TaxID=219305 RepID=UPI001E52E91F|nr:tetratricopeptide repeat protein [Micromonospora sp. ATCC 39149]
MLHRDGLPTRVLLIGRNPDAWPALRAALDVHQASTSTRRLAPLSGGTGPATARMQMFAAARTGFARHYGIPDPDEIATPDILLQPEMGLTLAVHIAALVAVDAYRTGRIAPADAAGQTVYLLDREQRHWADRHGDPRHTLGDPAGYGTAPAVMNQVVYIAALTGSRPPAGGVDLLHRLRIPGDPGRILADHAACYPSADPTHVLEPLYPDRLAEDFIALTVPGHDLDYPAQGWAPGTTDEILSEAPNVSRRTWDVPGVRSMVFLAAAAHRWPHLGHHYLYPLLLARPELAVAGGSPALISLATATHTPIAVLQAVARVLPADAHIDLDLGAAALSAALLPHQLTDADADEQILAYLGHAERLVRAGRFSEAIRYAEQGVDLARRWSDSGPEVRRLVLVAALSQQSVCAAQLGRWDEAIDHVRQAMVLRENQAVPLSDVNRADDLGRLSITLAGLLSEHGHYSEAVPVARHALDTYLALTEQEPGERHLRGAAEAAYNLCGMLASLGQHEEALPAGLRAVKTYQLLSEHAPGTYLPRWAEALTSLAVVHTELGYADAALDNTAQAVKVMQRAVRGNPSVQEPGLARALISRSHLLSQLGRYEQAVEPAREAVEIVRRCVAANPRSHRNLLVAALSHLAGTLVTLAHNADALTAAQEAAEMCLTESPGVVRPVQAAAALATLGTVLSSLGRHHDALAATNKARELLKAADGGDAHVAVLRMRAHIEINMGRHLAGIGAFDLAVPPASEAVRLYRRLADKHPVTDLPHLASALDNLGMLLPQLGEMQDAIASLEESVKILRQLEAVQPGVLQHRLAATLNNLGLRLAETDQTQRALDVAQESLTLFRELAATDPDCHRDDIALGVFNLSLRLHALGQDEKSLTTLREAVTMARQLSRENPGAHDALLAESLKCLALRLCAPRHRNTSAAVDEEAVAAAGEAVALLRRLYHDDPKVHQANLAMALGAYASVCVECGGNPRSAARHILEAMEHYDQLCSFRPLIFERYRIASIGTFASVLDALGDTDGAHRIRRGLAEAAGIPWPDPAG